MKIMFILPSLGSGGAERVVSVLANAFCDLNHQIVIAMLANNRVYYDLHSNVKTIGMAAQWENHSSAGMRIIKRIQAIKKTVKTEKPDVVISFMAETNIDVSIALMCCHVPLIVSERNDPSIDPPSRLKRMVRNVVYWRPNGFVFQTNDAKCYFKHRIQKKATIILNPLVAELPKPFQGEREKKIVSVGRLEKQKNYPMLLQAFERFHHEKPDYILEIYGEGQLEKEILDIIEQRKLSDCVKLMGFCTDVHEKIKDAAMFVMTSDYEGLPNALIEAMALGLPCISTDCPCGGPKTLIDNHKNGILINVGNVDELLRAMLRLTDASEGRDLGINAQAIRTRVDKELVTKQWIDFISQVKGRGNDD